LRHAPVAVGIGCLVVAAVVTVWTMLHGAGGTFEWSWFYPWALSPYLILGAVIVTAGTKTKPTRIASVIAAVAVSVGASFLYADAMFVHVSSTSALIFVFGPLYFLIGGLAIYALAAFVGRKLAATNDT
jgi:hypothetical protein